MPEGHTLHRLARDLTRAFAGHTISSLSPQGRFAEGAERVDGMTVTSAWARGKHLFVELDEMVEQVHVHLGLFGKWKVSTGDPEITGQVRWRIQDDVSTADLRGPTACELLAPGEVEALLNRLGPDPIVPGTPAEEAWPRISRSRAWIATLLMDQSVVAGVGNVYRAEVLFRNRIDPTTEGRELSRAQWDAIWDDLVVLMTDGVRKGRIETVRPEDSQRSGPQKRGRRRGESYVYKRTGEPCLVCGAPVQTAVLGARNLFWCPSCQGAARLDR